METSQHIPHLSDFTPLSDFQSQTPTSFHSGPPVLYHHTPRATLKYSSRDAAASSAFASFTSTQVSASRSDAPTNGTNGNSAAHSEDGVDGAEDETEEVELEMEGVGVWVTSTHFLLTSPSSPTLKIPYPSISLHALSSPPPSLYLQILTTNGPVYDDHDPDNTISLTIIPVPPSSTTSSAADPPAQDSADPPAAQDEAQNLYTALSACADLHPSPQANSDCEDAEDVFWNQNDPLGLEEVDGRGVGYLAYGAGAGTEVEEGMDGGMSGVTALPPPMPGSGGWITAENVGEFFDEEGNLREGTRLGEGAGRVRGRDEGEGDGENLGEVGRVNGDEEDETKWRRTG